MNLRRFFLVILGSSFILLSVNPGQHTPGEFSAAEPVPPPFLASDTAWVESVMSRMSLEEKIGQMIMVQAYSNRDEEHLEDLRKLVEKEHIGGIVFFQGSPEKQARMTNILQAESEVPLLIAMDAEWGLGMRLEGVLSYPRQMELGAIGDNDLIRRLGADIAAQLRELGVHMNFAPVADINNNPDNPVINTRSFGEDRENVSEKVNAYFTGMQSGGVLTTAKHFPGHGDTNTDSHLALPVLALERDRLDSLELYPFEQAILKGISGIMVGHLQVPALDARQDRPATLSDLIIHDLLVDKLDFKGLIVTDALNMGGATTLYEPGELEVQAVLAGNDILLMPEDVSKAVSAIRRAIRRDEITEERINGSCRKILLAKAWAGLDKWKPVDTKGLAGRLNDRKYLALQEMLAGKAITLLRNDRDIIPLADLDHLELATVNIGTEGPSPFTETLDLYRTGRHYFYSSPEEFPSDPSVNADLSRYNTLIISVYYTRSFGENYGIPEGVREFIGSIRFKGRMIINLFNYPYALGSLGDLEGADAVIVSYTNKPLNQQMAAQGIFGGISFEGRLPVSSSQLWPAGSGMSTDGGERLSYGSPESVHMNFDTLRRIDELVERAIREKAMPGCQVLVARNGRVVWNKAYGYHTYRNRQPVKVSDIYDLASITKIASTVPALMRLHDQGRFSVDSTIGAYYPGIDSTNKAGLRIRDVLTHQAGLEAWLPFYTRTIETLDTSESLFSTKFSYSYPYRIGPNAFANRNIVFRDSTYATGYSANFPIQVAEGMYLRKDFRDSVFSMIMDSEIGKMEYLYSDLGYYLLYRAVEEITDSLFYSYTWFNFFGPLGAETLGFLPLNRFGKARIVPTENDQVFRRQLIHGYVHDPGAAMLGGICGHAGLFSNANDLAKLMQMYLNNGRYGGRQYVDSATIAEFTRCQYCETENRRGLGFDRPIVGAEDAGPVCSLASERSFGHSGFTGTIAWADPEYGLLYIFLSNRVHPNQDNSKLVSMSVRTKIQEVIYLSMTDRQDLAPVKAANGKKSARR